MKKSLLTMASVAVLAMVLTIAQAQAVNKILLKVPVWFGAHLTGLGSTPKWLAEHVNEASGGSVKMKIYEPGKRVPPKEMLESVSRGQVNTGWTTPGYYTGLLGQKGAIFTAVPLVITTRSGSEADI